MKINFSLGKEWGELKKFEKLSDDERSVVFYAENIASMNHFRLLIDHLTKIMNLKICYVTSVKDDPIFSTINKNIFPFYIGDGTARTKFFLVLKALDITGEVIIPSFSFVATANAVVTAGAVPRFVDIDYQTCNMDPKNIIGITTN